MPVKLRIASDYAAVIEGQRAGNIQIAYYGPASFARARMTGVKTDAFAIDVNSDGSKGYYSVFYVLKDAPYQKIDDLKGKNLGLVDPNSTSGNSMPRFAMNGLGIDPEAFFGKVVYAGSHENAVLALAQGTIDVAANWWNAEDDSNLTRMLNKGMVKKADGTPMTKEDFRIVFKSEPDHELALCLSERPAGRAEDGDQGRLPQRGDEGARGIQQALRRQEQAVGADHDRRR